MSKNHTSHGMIVKGFMKVLLADTPEGDRINPKGVLKIDPLKLASDPMKFPYSEVDSPLQFYDMFAEEFGKSLAPGSRGIRGGDWIQMNTFTYDKNGNCTKTLQHAYVGKWQNNIVLEPHCDTVCHTAAHSNALFFLKDRS